MNDLKGTPRPIRLVVQEPALPKYRVPFFRELARRPGIQLKLYYSDTPNLPNAEPDGFDAIHVPVWRKLIAGRPFAWSTAQLTCIDPANTDVVLFGWDLHYLSLMPALMKARRNGIGTIVWGHGYSKHEAPMRYFLRRKVGEYANAVMFYNNLAAQSFIERGWPAERVFVALNSLDQEPIQRARTHWLQGDKLQSFRREQNLGEGPVILFVSRLEPDNRVDLLLEAAHTLQKDYAGLKVIVIGKGRDQQRLEGLVNRWSLNQRVRFLGAIYDEMQLAPWFLCANVFCYPANIGHSLLHSCGYGLPVITTNRFDLQGPEIEAFREGENGLSYMDGDVTSLTTTLRHFLSNGELAAKLAAGALQVRDRFNIPRMVDGCVAAVEYALLQARGNQHG